MAAALILITFTNNFHLWRIGQIRPGFLPSCSLSLDYKPLFPAFKKHLQPLPICILLYTCSYGGIFMCKNAIFFNCLCYIAVQFSVFCCVIVGLCICVSSLSFFSFLKCICFCLLLVYFYHLSIEVSTLVWQKGSPFLLLFNITERWDRVLIFLYNCCRWELGLQRLQRIYRKWQFSGWPG